MRLAGSAFWHHTIARSVFPLGMTKKALNSTPEPEIGGHKGKKDRADDAVHGEKGGIEAAQVAGRNDGVLVTEQERDGGDANPAKDMKVKEDGEPDEQAEHGQMHEARDPEGGRDADGLGQTVQSDGAVVLEVLAGVEDVKAGDPESEPRTAIQAAEGARPRARPRTRCDQRVTRFM
jgi:hypothetical protein